MTAITDTDDRTKLLIHKETGTRHVAGGEWEAKCGYDGVGPDAQDMWGVEWSSWLAHHPEDFGDLPSDCANCARRFNEDN